MALDLDKQRLGYIKLCLCCQSSDLWKDKRAFSRFEAWMDILMETRYQEKPAKLFAGGAIVEVSRGQCAKSLRTWAARWGWSKNKVQRFLELLESCGQIALKTDQQTGQYLTVFTVVNYDSYNTACDDDGTATGTFEGQRRTSDGPATDQNKNVKNGENEKKNTSGEPDNPVLPPAEPKVLWTALTGWSGITESMKAEWKEAYPACNIDQQLAGMNVWLKNNPAKAHKSNWGRFITNWLRRSQERGGDAQSSRAMPQYQDKRTGAPVPQEYLDRAPRLGQPEVQP